MSEVPPTLDHVELAILQPLATRRSVAAGEYLYREGDAAYEIYVVLSGLVEIVMSAGGEERLIANQPKLSDKILAAFMRQRRAPALQASH